MIVSLARRLISLGSDDREASDLLRRTRGLVPREEEGTIPGLVSPMTRREAVRRIFAIGAGIAVGGELIRQVPLTAPRDAFEASMRWYSDLKMTEPRMTSADLDRLLKEVYSQPLMADFMESQVALNDLVARMSLDKGGLKVYGGSSPLVVDLRQLTDG